MKKTTPSLILAIALMSSVIMGCSENDFLENTPQGKAVTLSTTISLDGSSATTRALDADGKKSFAAGEQIALVYEDANGDAQKVTSAALKDADISSDKKKATLSFNLEKAPKAGGNFTMIYPASMAQESLPSEGEFGAKASPAYTKLGTQDGTLASLSSNLDLAYCESQFSSNATLPYTIQLTNKLAILELTSITDYTGTNDLTSTITGLTVKVGSDASALSYSVTRTAAAGPIYVAMQSCESKDITITATDATNAAIKYEKTVTSQSLSASTMTPVSIKMQKTVNLALQTSNYVAQDGDILTGTLGAEVKISIAAGAAVTLRDANINMNDDGTAKWASKYNAGITCLGDATINLEGTNKVHGFNDQYPGIQAAHNTGSGDEFTLTIQGVGDGSLVATGSDYGAGIGGNVGKCGNIKIESGTITATGGQYGAGIGSGYPLIISSSCGDITISGGIITATGGDEAAGIGSGNGGNGGLRGSSCGNITISGGTITSAQGGTNAAGIGSGNGNMQGSSCGNITISGGTITSAQGGDYGAGIGSGMRGMSDYGTSSCGNISIEGGTITSAKGGANAAGIGSGLKGTFGNISISGGTITSAQGGHEGAGIGSGSNTTSTTSTITISGGEIKEAKGGTSAAGIGSGNGGKCGDITIEGGTIKEAKSGNTAAGIGSGYQGTCGNISIEGGTITSVQGGAAGAGIGSGENGTFGSITISGGTITSAQGGLGGAGIGSGGYTTSTTSTITISGGTITSAQGGDYGAGIGSGQNGKCGAITISGATTKITSAQGGACAAGIGSGYQGTCGDITITTGATITKAQGGVEAAGIGSGSGGKCGAITISGGTIASAKGGNAGAGIGSGYSGQCENIIITIGVTQVTATKGTDALNSIGKGYGSSATCGTVTIEDGANVIQN